jgi:diguanylate cyclase (GGDEF)-like protein/PAS domain S-box-containing protein
MNNPTATFIKDQIHTQNVYSFSEFKKIKLVIFLQDEMKSVIEPFFMSEKKYDAAFFNSEGQLINYIKETNVDAIVIGISTCLLTEYEHVKNICKAAGNKPVIAIGKEHNERHIKAIFKAGIHDLVPLDEVSSKHLLRVISYAVVRSKNLEKVEAFEVCQKGIIENATEGIFQTTPNGQYILANPALAKLYGYTSPQELINDLTNIEMQLYIDPQRRHDFAKIILMNDKVINFESEIRRKDGSLIWISENARTVRDANNDILYFEGFVRDITGRKNNEQKLRYLAQRDPLTGLPNRALYQERLSEALDEAKKKNTKVAIIFIDLDNFKTINDTMGHPVGDVVLQKVADRLTSNTNAQDTVARLSGDEFTVILRDINSDTAARVASRLLDALSRPMLISNKEVHTSGSIGVSIYPENGSTISELMQNVDTAAYHAKKNGRNSYQFYTENLSTQAIRRLAIENGLRHAIEKKELSLHYQPKVNLKDKNLIGAEALLRWNNPELGNISPVEFIPIAEETGLIIPIGEWVLNEACTQTKKWLDEGLNPGCISVNLSGRQFQKKGLLDMILTALTQSGLPPKHLELELTESALVKHINEAVSILQKLDHIGIKTSIDDFGTGYSSLSYLKKFPISTLKIDRSFVKDLPQDQEDMSITRAIISLGKSLDLKIIAEGIEDQDQCDLLTELNCDYGQGYLFGKPMPQAEFTALLQTKL